MMPKNIDLREDKILDCSNPQTVMSERELEVHVFHGL